MNHINLEDIILPIVGMSIPIVAMFIALAIARSALAQRTRRYELEHQERLLAIEKGAPLPPLTMPPQRIRNPYVWGFILISIGVAMCLAMLIEGDEDWGWGLLFLLPGIAVLAANLLYLKLYLKREKQEPPLTALPQESRLP
jgi:hypothetical protein